MTLKRKEKRQRIIENLSKLGIYVSLHSSLKELTEIAEQKDFDINDLIKKRKIKSTSYQDNILKSFQKFKDLYYDNSNSINGLLRHEFEKYYEYRKLPLRTELFNKKDFVVMEKILSDFQTGKGFFDLKCFSKIPITVAILPRHI